VTRTASGFRQRSTRLKEKPPILGLIQRGGEVVVRRLENVQQKTIEHSTCVCLAKGRRVYTDEYDV
jgi:hypothetical protein